MNSSLKNPFKYPVSILKMKILGTSSYSNTNKHLDNQQAPCFKHLLLRRTRKELESPRCQKPREQKRGGKERTFLPVLYTEVKGCPQSAATSQIYVFCLRRTQSKLTKRSRKGKEQEVVRSDRPN